MNKINVEMEEESAKKGRGRGKEDIWLERRYNAVRRVDI
jgi:hypothetical protein